jgi:hypothetical protein
MPRGRRVRRVESLEGYPWPELSASQVVDLVQRAGRRLELRTLHVWLRTGYVVGFKADGNREWLIPKASVHRLLAKCRRAA